MAKFCKCGCGKQLPQDRNRNGECFWLVGHHWRGRKRIGEKRNQYGSNNNNWKGGRVIDGQGYVQVRCEGHPRVRNQDKGFYVEEHILVMEKHLGRYLQPEEIVHHVNEIKHDNRIENLKLTTQEAHSSTHRKQDIEAGKQLFGGPHEPWNKGLQMSQDIRAKMSAARMGHVVSDETRRKISLTKKAQNKLI